MIPVNSPGEIPDFTNEDEEADFWATHSIGPGMRAHIREHPDPHLDALLPVRPRTRTRSITIHVDEDLFQRLEALAENRGLAYQSLLTELLVRSLDEVAARGGETSGQRASWGKAMSMTQAKELVREALERLSDEEAEQLLARVREIEGQRERIAIFARLAGDATFRVPAPTAHPFRPFEPAPTTGQPASELLIEERR